MNVYENIVFSSSLSMSMFLVKTCENLESWMVIPTLLHNIQPQKGENSGAGSRDYNHVASENSYYDRSWALIIDLRYVRIASVIRTPAFSFTFASIIICIIRMTMGEESPVSSLVLPVLIRPVLSQLEKRDIAASQTLRAALSKAEAVHPGFAYDLIVGLMRRGDLGVNMNESILRLQGAASDFDATEYRLSRSEDAFQELNRKSASLKKILSRIPDEIVDRKTFLETIKEIASAIKKLLDAVNEVSGFIPGPNNKLALEQRKREFVKFSKRFSNTLKDYFREGQANAVFVSALYLIHQTNMIMATVKNKCE